MTTIHREDHEGRDRQHRDRTPVVGPNPPSAGQAGSVTVGRVAGIPIRVHWTFLLLISLIVVGGGNAGPGAIALGILWIVALFGFVVAHEVSHCLMARRRGGVVADILLLPIGGVSRMTIMPEAPADELAVALVGPVTSLVIGIGLLGTGILTGVGIWPPTLFAGSWLVRLGWLNLVLGGFNLVPALPMDGGRVLRAALTARRGRLEATVLVCRIARVVAFALVAVGFLYDFWLVLIGLFVLLGAAAEEAAARQAAPPPPSPQAAPPPPR